MEKDGLQLLIPARKSRIVLISQEISVSISVKGTVSIRSVAPLLEIIYKEVVTFLELLELQTVL